MKLRTRHGAYDLQDTPLSKRIAALVVAQHYQHPARYSRPRIGILSSSGYLRDGGWPVYSGDGPTVHAILEVSTAWLSQRSSWSPVGERTRLSRGLISTTTGLIMVWLLPNWSGLVGLTCLFPLLVLDNLPDARRPLPCAGSVLDAWGGRYWNPNCWQPQVQERGLGRNWSSLAGRSLDAQQYLHLTLLASGTAVIMGGICGAIPTPFAGGLVASHALGKLGWLLMSQVVVLAIAAFCLGAVRGVVGFPNRLMPASWRPRALSLAVLMLFLTPAVGWLIDLSGSVDTVLIVVGLLFDLLLSLVLLVSGLLPGLQHSRSQTSFITRPGRTGYSWMCGASSIGLAY